LTNTNLRDFLRSRRSIRRFKAEPVPDSVIQDLLATATFAPSAHNRQPWRFAVVTTPAARQRLGAALTAKMSADMRAESAPAAEIEKRITISLRRIDEAPALILLCRDVTDVRADTPEEAAMGVQSVAMAGLQLLLAAHAEGLGGNWICWPLYAQSETRMALGLPDGWEPQGMVGIGYSDEDPKEKKLRGLDKLVKMI
jgi:F420 biosynthesis protein FbiB-like protein